MDMDYRATRLLRLHNEFEPLSMPSAVPGAMDSSSQSDRPVNVSPCTAASAEVGQSINLVSVPGERGRFRWR